VFRRGGLLGNYEDREDFNYTRFWSAAKMALGNLPDT
jgi:hypothetical protein